MRPIEALALTVYAAFAVACSNQSQNTKPVVVAQAPAAGASSSTATASTAAAGSAATAAGTASAANASGSATDPSAPKIDPALIKAGYRAVKRQGKILYCQTQSVTGTKFANTICMTAEQIQEQQRETEQSKRLLIRSGTANCAGTQCSN